MAKVSLGLGGMADSVSFDSSQGGGGAMEVTSPGGLADSVTASSCLGSQDLGGTGDFVRPEESCRSISLASFLKLQEEEGRDGVEIIAFSSCVSLERQPGAERGIFGESFKLFFSSAGVFSTTTLLERQEGAGDETEMEEGAVGGEPGAASPLCILSTTEWWGRNGEEETEEEKREEERRSEGEGYRLVAV